jgi:hypothetical protein
MKPLSIPTPNIAALDWFSWGLGYIHTICIVAIPRFLTLPFLDSAHTLAPQDARQAVLEK